MKGNRFNNRLIQTIAAVMLALLAGCSTLQKEQRDGPPANDISVANIHNPIPKAEPLSRYGNPNYYDIDGRRYHVLKTATGYNKTGIASWYGTKFHGRLTSTREPYDMFAMTAASPELPIPCYVRVTNLENGKQVIVRVNDRGPFHVNRILDLSYVAAKKLGFSGTGTALVQVAALNPGQTEPSSPRLASKQSGHPKVALPTFQTASTHHDKSPSRSGFYLQMGAFSERENAYKLRDELERVVHEPVQVSKIGQHRPIYKVQIGPVKTMSDSDRIQKTLERHGFKQGVPIV